MVIKMSFDVINDNYRKFINKIRRMLRVDLPICKNVSFFDGEFRDWWVIELRAYGAQVRVKINSRDFYLWGFESSNGHWYRFEEKDIDNFGPSIVLPYKGRYKDLKTQADLVHLHQIHLTQESMAHAIHVLRNFDGNFQNREVPLAMIKIIFTICEATRFFSIQRSIHKIFRNNATELALSHLETATLTKWDTISTAYRLEKLHRIPLELAIVSCSAIRNILAIGIKGSSEQDISDGTGSDGPEQDLGNGAGWDGPEQYVNDGDGGDGSDNGSNSGSKNEQVACDGAEGDGSYSVRHGGCGNLYGKDSAPTEMKGSGDIKCRKTASHFCKGVKSVAPLQLDRQWRITLQSQRLQIWKSERHMDELSSQIESAITRRCLVERTTGGRCFGIEEDAPFHSQPCQETKIRLLEVFSIQLLDFTELTFEEEIFGIIQLRTPSALYMLSKHNLDWPQFTDQNDGRRVHMIERDLIKPDQSVGEFLQPGGYLKLVELGLLDCVEEMDAQRVQGYALFKDGKITKLPHPPEKFHSNIAGRSFHHGWFIQCMHEKVSSLPNFRLEHRTVRTLLEEIGTIKGVICKKNTNGEELLKKERVSLTTVRDGCFCNLRHALCSPKVDQPFCLEGLVLENCKLLSPNYGPMVLVDASPILLYPISSIEVHCLVDVPEQKVSSIVNGGIANYLKAVVVPQPVAFTINTLVRALYKVFSASSDKARKEIQQAFLDCLSLGVDFSAGPISLLSGLNPCPLGLVGHIFSVAIYGVGCPLVPFPSPSCKRIDARVISANDAAIYLDLKLKVLQELKTQMTTIDGFLYKVTSLDRERIPQFTTFQGIHRYCIHHWDSKDNLIINKDSKAQLQEACLLPYYSP